MSDRLCTVPGCRKKEHAKGFCPMHHTRWIKYGDPLHVEADMHSGLKRAHPDEYRAWQSMKTRCYNRKCPQYPNYGGRGINVCPRWLEQPNGFKNFYEDMGDRPSKKHSLDRIDVNGPYSPSNCRWGDLVTQNNNRRKTRYIDAFGKRQSITEWALELSISRGAICQRYQKGERGEYALRPVDKKKIHRGEMI